MKKLLGPMICMLFIGLLMVPAYAQAPDKPAGPGGEVTITGCLKQGASAQQFTITDDKTGETYTVAGADTLASHVNHTVKLTGEAKGKAFTAKSVDHVAPTCSAGKKE
jgi:hypothetical protein